jgi:ABC-type transport system involved in multi-copper enzyme maturation permease subunit
LSLLMSYPVRRPTLLFAKWLGGYISLLISLCPAMLLMLAFLSVSSVVSLQTEDWIRLAGIVGLSLLYLLVFFTLGLLTSTLTHQPATALILVLSVWAMWVLGVPRIGCSAAKGLRPIQPNFTFGLHKRAVRQGSVEDFQETLWKMDDEYIATVDAQMTMAKNLSRFSPFTSYVYASTTLAQTGITDAQNFRRQVADWDRERRRGRPTELSLTPLQLEQSFLGMTHDLILLLSWNAILFMGAYVAFLRYDVR